MLMFEYKSWRQKNHKRMWGPVVSRSRALSYTSYWLTGDMQTMAWHLLVAKQCNDSFQHLVDIVRNLACFPNVLNWTVYLNLLQVSNCQNFQSRILTYEKGSDIRNMYANDIQQAMTNTFCNECVNFIDSIKKIWHVYRVYITALTFNLNSSCGRTA